MPKSLGVSSSEYAYAHHVNTAEGAGVHVADGIHIDAIADVDDTGKDVDVGVDTDADVDIGVDVDVAVASVMQEPTHPCRN